MHSPLLKIKDLEISPPLALAPMVGISHSAMRCLLLELGGVGVFFTEMLSAKRLPEENERVSPLLIRSPIETPLIYQIFVTEKCIIEPSIKKLHTLNAQGIDINLGCPAPQLRKIGAGSILTSNSSAVKNIIKTTRNITNLPLTVKLRLGVETGRNEFTDLCKMLQDEGVDCLTVHARFNGEKFCRKPRWERLAELKKELTIPFIANGGIHSLQDAKKCLEVTGADGLMIGRAAAEKPWIFSNISSQIYGLKFEKQKTPISNIYMRFAELLQARFSKEKRLGRLKQFTHYFAGSFQFGHYLASSVQTSNTLEQALERADQFFTKSETLYI